MEKDRDRDGENINETTGATLFWPLAPYLAVLERSTLVLNFDDEGEPGTCLLAMLL